MFLIRFLVFIAFMVICMACPSVSYSAEAQSDSDLLAELLWPGVSNAPASKRPSVGIALAGGGARAFTHTGVLQEMKYENFPIDYVTGTSMGSVIGAYYAAGLPFEDLWNLGDRMLVLGIKKDFLNLGIIRLIFTGKMMQAPNIKNIIEEMFGDRNIEDLPKPFACIAVDVRTGERVVLRSGPVALAVRSSSNFPGFFEPIAYDQRYLIDGGVIENVPVGTVKAMGADWIIASVDNIVSDNMPENVYSVLMQVINVRGNILASESVKQADFVIDPPVGSISTVAFEKTMEAAFAGLAQTVRDMPAMKKAYMIKAIPMITATPIGN